MRNTGANPWPVTGLHLAVASPAGSADPFAGGSTTPGTFTGNVTDPGATSVEPGQVARFVVHLDAKDVAVGSYAKAYAVRIGTAPVFGQFAQWVVDVVRPTFRSELVGFGPAFPDGSVAMPRDGSVSLTVKVRNTGDVAWPLNGAVKLATSDARYRESPSYGAGWPSKSQVGPVTAVDGVSGATEVKPGQVGVFPMTLYGNGLPAGVTDESFEVGWFGYAWVEGAKLTLHVVRTDPAVSRLASLVSGVPSSMRLFAYPGDKRTLTFRLRNLGGDAWPVAGGEIMATANPAGRADALRTSAWLSSSRATRVYANVSKPGAASVAPGEVAEYRVPIDPTNKAAATYGEWFRALVSATGAQYGPTVGSSVTVSAATLSATVMRNTSGLVVPKGGYAAYTISLKNTGNVPWQVGGSFRLSSPVASKSYTTGWLSAIRPTAIDANSSRPGATSVLPGEVARLSFWVAANGRAAGSYTETFGAGWEAWRSTGLRIPVTYVIR
jgi:hypothetical protein